MAEIWKAVVGYEGFYEVSNLGRVRSLSRLVRTYGGREWMSKERIMKLTPVKDKGYLVVSLRVDGDGERRYVHDLVLCAFVGPRPNEQAHCCHGTAGPGVNTVENLRWDTPQANVMDKHRDGTMQIGEQHWKNVYSEAQIKKAKELLSTGLAPMEVSKALDIHVATVRQVKSGRQWAHLGSSPRTSSYNGLVISQN